MLSLVDCNFHAEISSLCRVDKPGAFPQHNGLTPFRKVGVHFGDRLIDSSKKFLTLNKRDKFLLFFSSVFGQSSRDHFFKKKESACQSLAKWDGAVTSLF